MAQKNKKTEHLVLSTVNVTSNQFRVSVQYHLNPDDLVVGGNTGQTIMQTPYGNMAVSGSVTMPDNPGFTFDASYSTILYCGSKPGKWAITCGANMPNYLNGQYAVNEGQFNNLLPNTDYFVWVVRQRGDQIIAQSDTIRITTMKQPDETNSLAGMKFFMQNVQATSAEIQAIVPGMNTGFVAVVTACYGLDSSEMVYSTNPNLIIGQQGGSNAGWGLQNLIPGKKYYFQVRSIDGDFKSKIFSFATASYK